MIEKMIQEAKVIVCIGSGGVGKTTTAAAIGVRAAQVGKKVLVLTIDPAKRLATTLGIEGKSDITRVPGQNFKGELYASVIDHQKVFDEFVDKAAEQAPLAAGLKNNRLYKQLSTNLSGSQDFTAVEKLYSCYKSGEFDLIILDTPPAKHAIDFLRAPEKLAALFNQQITQWFSQQKSSGKNLIQNLINLSTQQVFKVLENLTGSQFISELRDFFSKIEGWQNKLQERTSAVHRLLTSDQTQFVLVTSFDAAKLKEAEALAKELRKNGYYLRELILNRAYPDWLNEKKNESFTHESIKNLYGQFVNYYSDRQTLFEQLTKKLPGDIHVTRIQEMKSDISDLKGLEELCVKL